MDFYYAKSIQAFFKKTTKKNSNLKYSLECFYLPKYEIAVEVKKFLISIFLIKHSCKSLILNYIKSAIYEIL